MHRECQNRFPRHLVLAIPTCITGRAWSTCCEACQDRSLVVSFGSRWRGKHSRHSRRMRNPQFYLSGKKPMGRGGLPVLDTRCSVPDVHNIHLIWNSIWVTVSTCIHFIKMSSSINFLFEQRTVHITMDTYMSNVHDRLMIMHVCRDVSGLTTDSPCCVWGRGWTTCLLYGGPLLVDMYVSYSGDECPTDWLSLFMIILWISQLLSIICPLKYFILSTLYCHIRCILSHLFLKIISFFYKFKKTIFLDYLIAKTPS